MANQPPKQKPGGNLALSEIVGLRKEMRKLFRSSSDLFHRVEDALEAMGTLRRRIENIEAELVRTKYGER